MQNTITCPHCKKDFGLSDTLIHRFKEEADLRSKEENERKIKEAQEKTRKELEEKEKKRDQEFKERELLLEKNARKLEEEKKKNKEIEESYEKRRKEDEGRIREEVSKKSAEDHRLEKLQYEKKFGDMQKALEEAQRKGRRGSSELQGEVLELDLEEQLKTHFPVDEFLPVPKGVEGGDIWQKVIDKNGKLAGSILWETKRTKAWSPSWLPKLREDGRKIGASECILISDVLPSDIKSFHRKDNVWISNYEYAIHTARTLRFLVLSIAVAKSAVNHNDNELKAIRDYIISDAFRHKFESHQESVNALREGLTADKRATEIRWKKQEVQIDRLDRNSSQMYGELQGIIGDELPDIKTPDLLEEGKAEE